MRVAPQHAVRACCQWYAQWHTALVRKALVSTRMVSSTHTHTTTYINCGATQLCAACHQQCLQLAWDDVARERCISDSLGSHVQSMRASDRHTLNIPLPACSPCTSSHSVASAPDTLAATNAPAAAPEQSAVRQLLPSVMVQLAHPHTYPSISDFAAPLHTDVSQ